MLEFYGWELLETSIVRHSSAQPQGLRRAGIQSTCIFKNLDGLGPSLRWDDEVSRCSPWERLLFRQLNMGLAFTIVGCRNNKNSVVPAEAGIPFLQSNNETRKLGPGLRRGRQDFLVS